MRHPYDRRPFHEKDIGRGEEQPVQRKISHLMKESCDSLLRILMGWSTSVGLLGVRAGVANVCNIYGESAVSDDLNFGWLYCI